MPLFRRQSDEEKRRVEEERAEAQASLESLASGGLPLHAQRRLEEVRGREDRVFTSDLSVDEFLLARHGGLQPITQVMGSSISRIARPVGMGWGGTGELTPLSDGINDTRTRALGRLLAEARLVGAHAVLGVRVTQRTYDWGAELLEFTAIGTAVRLAEAIEGSEPAITDLSGQEFWKLYTAGFWPVGICASTSVYHVYSPGWGNVNLMFGAYANQELRDFSAGAYAARAFAMRRIHAQAHETGATGLVGVSVEQHQRVLQESEGTGVPMSMLFTFTAMGTAITELSGRPAIPGPRMVMNLKK